MNVQNINITCEICGQTSLVASEIILKANYGSLNDGERIKLKLCDDCIDKAFDVIQTLKLLKK